MVTAHRVHHFTHYLGGGAGVAVRRLHTGLRERGADSHVWFHVGSAPEAHYHSQRTWYSPARWFRIWSARQANRITRKAGFCRAIRPEFKNYFTDAHQTFDTPLPVAVKDGVIHLHWVSFLLDLETFLAGVAPDRPVVWTLHDLNPLTGGCHYAWDCERFVQACGDCPQLARPSPSDVSARNWQIKSQALGRLRNFHVVGDSTWVEREARRSSLFANATSLRTIHYGLDTKVFCPGDRAAARRRLGIGEDAFVVSFGAQYLDEHRKGAAKLEEALAKHSSLRNAVLLTFGLKQEVFARLPQRIVSIGATNEAGRLAELHRAADVFVMPSLQEAFGQTALEALACGTPVVGFDTGGIPDMVRPGETGLLAEPGAAESLANQLLWMQAHSSERSKMGRAARRLVEEKFTLDRQAAAYIKLYDEIAR